MPGHADAARELREPGDVGVALVDALQGVLGRVQQVAARHLRVNGAGVEQRGRRRQVRQRRDQVVEADRLGGVGRQAAADPQEEVLRGLDHLACLGVAQQVAVVHGAQPEELEVAVALGVDGGVELRGVGLDEGEHVVADQAQAVAEGDRLGEPGDVLVAHLLVDADREQAGGELGVVRLLHDEPRGGADRQLVELAGGGAVGERRDGAGGHHHRVHAEQPLRGAGHGVDDLVDVDRLEGAVALAHLHAGSRGLGRAGLRYGRQLLAPVLGLGVLGVRGALGVRGILGVLRVWGVLGTLRILSVLGVLGTRRVRRLGLRVLSGRLLSGRLGDGQCSPLCPLLPAWPRGFVARRSPSERQRCNYRAVTIGPAPAWGKHSALSQLDVLIRSRQRCPVHCRPREASTAGPLERPRPRSGIGPQNDPGGAVGSARSRSGSRPETASAGSASTGIHLSRLV